MIFFFDIDGTLMVHDEDKSYIPDSAKSALQMLRDKGYEVVIATGRNLLQSKSVLDELDINNAILCDGATILVDGDIVEETWIDKETTKSIVKQIHDNKIACTAHNSNANYFVYENSGLRSFLFGVKRDHVHNFIPEITDSNHYATFAVFEDYEFKDIDNVQYSKIPIGGVIQQKGVTKASGIKSYLKYKSIFEKKVIVFGDSYNDKEMFEEFYENSYVMGNADDQVKQFAKNITADIKQDGIAITINEILKQK